MSVKITLETSGEDLKITLETSGEDQLLPDNTLNCKSPTTENITK
jgi:hypothetical protein